MDKALRIAVVHYHLRTGGVTRVIENAVQALIPLHVSCAIFAGKIAPDTAALLPHAHQLPALNYGTQPDHYPIEPLLADMKRIATETLGGPPDIWHVHNHSLGKNTVVPEMIRHLALDGEKVLLQIHDFPEDGRPANYRYLQESPDVTDHLDLCLYPQAHHIHYATLNGRDYGFLKTAGISPHQLHLLPNAIAVHKSREQTSPSTDKQRLFLYPTRAIRRKNLGEFLLWSTLAEAHDLFATSLIPENPVARKIHDKWVALAQELSLPVEFARGRNPQRTLADLYNECFSIVTTSVAEGFGLAFLEPWLFDRPLLGRNIPDITHEFSDAGINLASLYPRLQVPIDLISYATFKQTIATALTPFMEAYGRTLNPGDIQQAVDAAIQDNHVDFGRLDEPLQAQIIRQAAAQPNLRDRIFPTSLTSPHIDPEIIQQNRNIVETKFGLEQYGHRLHRIYTSINESTSEPVTGLPRQQVLDQFLKPERFTLLRT